MGSRQQGLVAVGIKPSRYFTNVMHLIDINPHFLSGPFCSRAPWEVIFSMSERHPDEPDLGITKPCLIRALQDESPRVASLIETLGLGLYIKGGYFKETDVSVAFISSLYTLKPLSEETLSLTGSLHSDFKLLFYRLLTTIYYYHIPNCL